VVIGAALGTTRGSAPGPTLEHALDAAARTAAAWAALEGVLDPEVPALSLIDLGIVREVRAGDDGVDVVLTPTYSGCPATEVIEQSVVDALNAAGFGPVRVTLQRAPAWTTAWMSDAGRRKLRDYGIAPPGPVDLARGAPLRFVSRRVACPRCASVETEQLSAFGATACKSLWRCLVCREPFEHFKAI